VSTLTLVDEIKLKAPNWSRDGSRSILAMLNRAQNFLFAKPCDVSIYVDPGTGDYPFLETTGTTRDYEISDVQVTVDDEVGPVPLRIFKVHEVFSENISMRDYGAQTVAPQIGSVIANKIVWKTTNPVALQEKRARVRFPFDPGTYTDRYRIKCIIEPLQLTADSIPLMVSQVDEEVLMEGALGFIEYHDYGRSDRLANFKTVMAPQFWEKYGGIETLRKITNTPRRKF